MTTKQFLSSIQTKNDLTEYLCKKIELHLDIKYVLVYGNTCISNISNLNPILKTYSQEEADTGIVLHAIDICKGDPSCTKLVITCSDTDVLLILLNYVDELNNYTIFWTLHHDIILHIYRLV